MHLAVYLDKVLWFLSLFAELLLAESPDLGLALLLLLLLGSDLCVLKLLLLSVTVLLDLAQAILRSLLLSPHGSLLAGKLSLPVNILHCLHNAVHSLVANSVDGCVFIARIELTDMLNHLLVILYSAVMLSLSSHVDVAFSLLVLGARGLTLLLLGLLLFESGSLSHFNSYV